MGSKVDILGVSIDKVDLIEAKERVAHFVSTGCPHQILTVNMDFISRSLKDPEFKDLINSASLSVPDGMPILWVSALLGDQLPQRITGMDLLRVCCQLAQERNQGIFLLGAEPGVAQQASIRLRQRYPGLRIAGTYSPPFGNFTLDENKKMVRLVVTSGASYLFVALGCPKQDFWIRQNLRDLGVPVCVGVGGVFNYLTGRVRRAPALVQNAGFEWLFRITQQPQLARRYLIDDLPVFTKAVGHSLISTAPAKIAGSLNSSRLVLNPARAQQIASAASPGPGLGPVPVGHGFSFSHRTWASVLSKRTVDEVPWSLAGEEQVRHVG